MALGHVDVKLQLNENAGHIGVVVQALLHCDAFLNFLKDDEAHRSQCRSLLQCVACAFHKIAVDSEVCGISDPIMLIGKWKVASAFMSPDQQKNPIETLSVFIDILCNEYAQRDSKEDLRESIVAKIWYRVVTLDVSCASCGQYQCTKYQHFVNLSDEPVTNLEESLIMENFFSGKVLSCGKCTCTSMEICLADCLIIHVKCCSPEFVLPFHIKLLDIEWALKSLIVDPLDEPCFVVTSCPGNIFRRFDDCKISMVSAAALSVAKFLCKSRLTIFFERRKKQCQQKVPQKENSTQLSRTEEELCYNEVEDENNTENIARFVDAETQTSPQAILVDVGIQTLPYYCYETCKFNPKFKFYTGLDVEEFQALFDLIGGDEVISRLKRKYSPQSPTKLRPQKLTSEDKLLMFLLRLRRGYPLEELSETFKISVSLVSELCYIMTRLIYLTFKGMEDKMFPTATEQRKIRPDVMKPFKNLRIILDGVSFYIESPSNFEQKGNTYSKYKTHSVIIFSVGMACNGATIFCSPGMEGSMADKKVIIESGLLNKLSKGDGVMCDRGYELTAELQAIGCELYKPPSLGDRDCFTKEEEILTKALASARVYVEHIIADIKDNRLLQGVIPIRMIANISDLVYIAAYLRNFYPSRITNKTFVYRDRSNPDVDELKSLFF